MLLVALLTDDMFVGDDEVLDVDGVMLDADDAMFVADDVTVAVDVVVVTVVVAVTAGRVTWDDSPLHVTSPHGKAPGNEKHHHHY